MFSLGKRSRSNLSTVHPRLQDLAHEVIKIYDIYVEEGGRGEEKQNRDYASGASHVQWPNSKHNPKPSLAVHFVPWPIDWNDRERFYALFGIVYGIAWKLGMIIGWGGDWPCDLTFHRNIKEEDRFDDLAHYWYIGER